jgi:hypothetical protein
VHLSACRKQCTFVHSTSCHNHSFLRNMYGPTFAITKSLGPLGVRVGGGGWSLWPKKKAKNAKITAPKMCMLSFRMIHRQEVLLRRSIYFIMYSHIFLSISRNIFNLYPKNRILNHYNIVSFFSICILFPTLSVSDL